jgi:hypothetical protein
VVAVGLYQARVSVVPVIQPDTAISSSSSDLPITARNPGDFFPFEDVKFFCAMKMQEWKGDENVAPGFQYYRATGLIEWTVPQPPTPIAPGNTVTFPCDIAKNSVLRLGGAEAPLMLIQMSIRTTYSINLRLFQWRREVKSQTFT